MISLDSRDFPQALRGLEAGQRVELSGPVYTARDAAHKRLFGLLDEGKPLPIEIAGATIYYAGPTPTPPGRAIGSCGPTTSARLDPFTPRLLKLGLAAMIGKGERSSAVNEAIKACGGVYFCAVGGAGALISAHITEARVIAFEELGCEAIRLLTLDRLPLTVGVDTRGISIFGGDVK